MIILTVRTDKPESELGLYKDGDRLDYLVWTAHRQLAATLHSEIDKLLSLQKMGLKDIEGIVCFKGPGSFTGLRIGLCAANTIAYSYSLPIVAEEGDDWLITGIGRLQKGESEKLALPEYGGPAFTTTPKK